MIKPDAKLSIREIPIECLQIKAEHEIPCSPARVMFYYNLFTAHPDQYAGLGYVVPSDTHEGMFNILDGRHRYLASIMANKTRVLCVVEEE